MAKKVFSSMKSRVNINKGSMKQSNTPKFVNSNKLTTKQSYKLNKMQVKNERIQIRGKANNKLATGTAVATALTPLQNTATGFAFANANKQKQLSNQADYNNKNKKNKDKKDSSISKNSALLDPVSDDRPTE